MLNCQKHLFSIPDEVSYLNCSYMSPLAEPVEMAGYQAVKRKCMPWEIGVADFFEPVDRLKTKFASLINASEHHRVAIVPSVSYGIAAIAKNIKIQAGQNVVVIDEIFPSNFFSWQRLVDEAHAKLRVVKRPEQVQGNGRAWNLKLLESIDSQTVVVALPHVHWTDGTLFDLVAIRQRCNEVGAALIIDGTQSVGAYPFDVTEIKPDALVCAGYKWLLGAYGLGLAYFGERFDGGVPIEENWINRANSENFENLTKYQSDYKPFAHRYCMGEQSQFITVPMLSAALDLILNWGVENIQAYTKVLANPFIEQLLELGFNIEEPACRSSHLFGVRFPKGIGMDGIKRSTLAHNVYVSYRAGAMRISPHVYNNANDFERLITAIKHGY